MTYQALRAHLSYTRDNNPELLSKRKFEWEKWLDEMAQSGRGECCGSCRFFVTDFIPSLGCCVRKSPTGDFQFPEMPRDGWCGEWEKKQNSQ